MLGASTWRIEEITRDRVIVTPAPGEPGRCRSGTARARAARSSSGGRSGAFVRELPRAAERAAARLRAE